MIAPLKDLGKICPSSAYTICLPKGERVQKDKGSNKNLGKNFRMRHFEHLL